MSNIEYRRWLRENSTDRIFNRASVRLCQSFAVGVRAYVLCSMDKTISEYGDIRDQLARSSVSCSSNCTEAWCRYNKDARRMCFYAKGSAAEAVQQLRICGAPEELIQQGLQCCYALDKDLMYLSED